jgi:hypothetical protein
VRPAVRASVLAIQNVTLQNSFGWPCTLSTVKKQTRYETRYSAYDFPIVDIAQFAPSQTFFPGKMAVNALFALLICAATALVLEYRMRMSRFTKKPAA